MRAFTCDDETIPVKLRTSEIFLDVVCMPLQIYILGCNSIFRMQVFKLFVEFF